MQSFIYLLLVGSLIIFMIMKFDVQQRRRLNKLVKETRNVQPLFLLRATEQKLRLLNTQLYGSAPASSRGGLYLNEGARQLIASQLSKLVSDYNSRKITLKMYNTELGEVLKTVDEISCMRFEQVNNS